MAFLVLFALTGSVSAEDDLLAQCRDPLFQTHWYGKNDIQTLTAFPTVKTNLKLCPLFNQRASCCHQTFETEQQKYFDFWKMMLMAKFARSDSHRQAVQAQVTNSDPVAQQQAVIALDKYRQVLRLDGHQSTCLSDVLTYVAGAICFSCKPEWFRYAVIIGKTLSAARVVRLRMDPTVCVRLWDSCSAFGERVASLLLALQDSAIARSVALQEEDLRMFASQQALCDWLHDQIALHPFKLPSKEDMDLPKLATDQNVSAEQSRRTASMAQLDILTEGQLSGFDRRWRTLSELSFGSGAPSCKVAHIMCLAVGLMVCA